MSATQLARISVRNDQDVFAMRRMGREVAAASGMSEQDQIRVATALSEVGREIVIEGHADVGVAFLLDGDDLVVSLSFLTGDGHSSSDGMVMAGRLMDAVEVDRPGQVIMRKRLTSGPPALPVGQIRARIDALTPTSALEELRQQNRELATTLEEVQQLNAELEETNQGVMALYNQLSAELEETNRGVVALYAELDEKSLQLREAGEAKNRFWATVSHELRTPLNSIIGLVRLLTGPGGEPLGTEQTHQIDLIGSSAETLLALVSELLDLAKAEAGRLDPQPTTVDLVALIERLRLTLWPTSGTERVSLTAHVPEPAPTMLADEAMLIRILRNLLANSLKFTDDGEVTLRVAHDAAASEMVFTVTDTGIGIPAEHVAHVFEEFYQVPGPAQLRAKGTGLGLPYARRLAEAMGGSLVLTSSQGQGTTATLRLPHTPDDIPVVNRILIADDDENFRAGLRRMLTGFAVHIDEAPDGAAALAAMGAAPPDLALLDLLMPGLGGAALRQRMADDARLRDIPVIIVTAASSTHHPDHADAVLFKAGLRRDVLLGAIRQALGSHHA
ncbi:ATP-binding protein [Nonomuraea cavernae]|uniref:histidine kinase n=1 Tax=Nonomuraea cavernae TaxID=2045107 RepID=A0A918DTN2_9ACTN|nr:ATP-binding protein [Nonomuraea cavernae]MCA2190863.1 response regulator [Nonomuraea cavernae]GGO82886.1 sensor histidine kinase [Nonomuraea cavernae]